LSSQWLELGFPKLLSRARLHDRARPVSRLRLAGIAAGADPHRAGWYAGAALPLRRITSVLFAQMNLSDLTIEERADSFVGSMQRHSKQILAGAIGLAALLGAAYFYNSSQATKGVAAERAYYQAQQSIASGNVPLATTDLRKAADRFRGTPAGNQAAFALAQLLYDQGKYADGVATAQRVEAKTDAERASRESLIGAGLEGQGKFVDAAQRYKAAASAAKLANEKLLLRANEARAWMAAGRKAEARAIWTELSADPASPLADEAKVRLGELTAAPAA
jgi:predicted negative regulator of RcsB-dependent stress response